MNKPTATNKASHTEALARLIAFAIVATVGMASVGMALLAKPVSQYCADKAFIAQQADHIQQLKLQVSQQEELLQNASNPAVLERFAVANLRYMPSYTARNQMQPLTQTWPALEYALAAVEQPVSYETSFYGIPQLADKLTAQPQKQLLLLLSGAALVLVSLTCFGRR